MKEEVKFGVKFSQSAEENSNYFAAICRIDKIEPIPDADKLVKTVINGFDMVISKNMKPGDIVVYFPMESAIDGRYLRYNNLYNESHADLNANYEQYKIASEEDKKFMRGFFPMDGRVKILKLRGIYSQGFVADINTLMPYFDSITDFYRVNWEDCVGMQFDGLNGYRLCTKWINPNIHRQMEKIAPGDRFDKLIPGRFQSHYTTRQIEQNLDVLNPNDNVCITVKLHGTSMVLGNVLCNKKLNWFQKTLKKIGFPIKTTEYNHLYGSHNILKNRWSNGTNDLWGQVNEKIKDICLEGMTIYGEIVGYQPNTAKFIQKNHDYGCYPGTWKFMPYRIVTTSTDSNGVLKNHEWNMGMVIQYTKALKEQKGLENISKYIMIPTVVYEGLMGNLYPDIKLTNIEEWRQEVLAHMKNDKDRFGMELDEPLCHNKVPREGVVIRIDELDDNKEPMAWKLKTNAHYALSSKQRDAGEVDIEEEA